MTDGSTDSGRTFLTAFLPGLVIGLVVGAVSAIMLGPFLDKGPKLSGTNGGNGRIIDSANPPGHNHPGEMVEPEDPNAVIDDGADPVPGVEPGEGEPASTPAGAARP